MDGEMMEIGIVIADITDKEAGDIVQQIVLDLQGAEYTVTDYYISLDYEK